MTTSPRAPRPPLSAVARWLHRDPVEGGNPFTPGHPRRDAWTRATAAARAALAQHDDALAASVPATHDPRTYGQRLIRLATMRFDTWARRGLAAVDGDDARGVYEAWLRVYVANWRAYVSDTCPHVATTVQDALHARLRQRATHWATQAQRAPTGAVHGTVILPVETDRGNRPTLPRSARFGVR